MSNKEAPIKSKPFIQTKEYLRFEEFVQSCIQYKYIGICHGNPGVGKTFAATHYTNPELMLFYGRHKELDAKFKRNFKTCKGAMFTVPVSNTPKSINHLLRCRINEYGHAAMRVQGETDTITLALHEGEHCPLLIVDEVDRLNYNSLEELRDYFDKHNFGMVLMGMPGIEKRLARYAQLYSRIGFVHEFKAISKEEMKFLFEQKWKELGYQFDQTDFVDVDAMNEIIKITKGNFRLINRIFDQLQRLMKINNIKNMTQELIQAARNCLVIGDFL